MEEQDQDAVRYAKVFLASRIAEEAEANGVPLSEIERKELYYSPEGWTLPDMAEVHEEFERDINRKAYEARVRKLIGRVWGRLRSEGDEEYEAWNEAVRSLRKGDHYLHELILGARPAGDLPRLILTALVIAAVMMAAIYLASRH